MKKQVLIQLNIEGFHKWRNAPKIVSFLSDRHRHTFLIKAAYEVLDMDREKEIFIQRDIINSYLNESYGSPCEFDNMSCEMIANQIMEFAAADGMVWCEVWEEKTGGARIEL